MVVIRIRIALISEVEHLLMLSILIQDMVSLS